MINHKNYHRGHGEADTEGEEKGKRRGFQKDSLIFSPPNPAFFFLCVLCVRLSVLSVINSGILPFDADAH